MKARKLIEEFNATKFRKPENFDPVAEGTGWVMYAGANDWEAGITWVAVVFPSDEANRRVWFQVKHSNADSDQPEERIEQVKKHGDKAWRKWKQTALVAHRNKNHGARSWLEAFKTALKDREMQTFIKTSGVENTSWTPEANESVMKVAEQVMDHYDWTLRRLHDTPKSAKEVIAASK